LCKRYSADVRVLAAWLLLLLLTVAGVHYESYCCGCCLPLAKASPSSSPDTGELIVEKASIMEM